MNISKEINRIIKLYGDKVFIKNDIDKTLLPIQNFITNH